MKISFTGDIMCELDTLRKSKHRNNYNFNDIFNNTKSVFLNTDFLVGNLETVFSKEKSQLTSDIYQYCSPYEFGNELKNIGFNLVSTANNHCLDRGLSIQKNTLNFLDSLGIKHVGTRTDMKNDSYFILEAGSLKIGFISWTYGTNYAVNHNSLSDNELDYINIITTDTFKTQSKLSATSRIKEKMLRRETRIRILKKFKKKYNTIRVDDFELKNINNRLIEEIHELRNSCDMIIALMHSGGQFNPEPGHYSTQLYNLLLSEGVDIIVGNHPHIVQKYEKRNNKLIFYSLGNFYISTSAVYLLTEYKPEYSIALHFDTETKLYSFSILKLVKANSGLDYVTDTFDLYNSMAPDDAQILKSDLLFIKNRFCNTNDKDITVMREYQI